MEENNQNNYGIPTGNVGSENQMFGVGSENQVYAPAQEQPMEYTEDIMQDVDANYVEQPQVNKVQVEVPQAEPVQSESVMTQAPQVTEQPQAQAQAQEPPVQKPQEILPEVDSANPKIVIKTSVLKSAIAKADIVAGKKELLPVTEVVVISVLDNNIVQLKSTDKDNILIVNVEAEEATPGWVISLNLSDFKPLIDKTNSERIIITAENNGIVVLSPTGKYRYNLAVDLTTNKVITIPEIPVEFTETYQVTRDQFLKPMEEAYALIKSMADDVKEAAVHLGKNVTSSTGSEVAAVAVDMESLTGGTTYLKSNTVRDLVSLGVSDMVTFERGTLRGTKAMKVISKDDYELFFISKEGEEDYPVEEINRFLESKTLPAVCVSKKDLLSLLDRLGIFFKATNVRKRLDFTASLNKLTVANEDTAEEYISANGNANFNIKLDSERLNMVLKAISTDALFIEPLDNEGTVSFVKISSSDRLQSYVLASTL